MYGKIAIFLAYFVVLFVLLLLLFFWLEKREKQQDNKFKSLHKEIQQFLNKENQFLRKRKK